MPIIDLTTNIPDAKIPADFDLKLCELVGEILKKPIERITLTIQSGLRQLRAGSSAPMVAVQIHSIGVFDKDRNPSYGPPLMAFICKALELPESRVNIIFTDLLITNVGNPLK